MASKGREPQRRRTEAAAGQPAEDHRQPACELSQRSVEQRQGAGRQGQEVEPWHGQGQDSSWATPTSGYGWSSSLSVTIRIARTAEQHRI
jgi:hypothetical protein